jgi:hypothetical protein
MGTVSAKVRAKTAVVHVRGAPASGQKFPIPDKRHAELAEARKNQAKPPLTRTQKGALDRRAKQFGVGPLAHPRPTRKG